MNNCLVGQSGGPTAAINASLAGVIAGVMASEKFDNIYGLCYGIKGLFDDEITNLSETFKDEASLEALIKTPDMYLGSCRYKLPNLSDDEDAYKTIFKYFEDHDIKAFFYIGGNDSMDTVAKLSSYAKANNIDVAVVGVPKTIDNDLVKIDHTPGFGSAAKYVATSVLEVAYDTSIYKDPSVTIVEVMGRDAGWLTASAALARLGGMSAPHLIYLPESAFSIDEFIEDVKACIEKYRNVVVAISEGIRDAKGDYISAAEDSLDQFGHAQLSGAGKTLERLVSDKVGVKVRSIELNILQRSAEHLASKVDLDESVELGKKAVSYAADGITGVMSSHTRVSNSPYKLEFGYEDISKIANEVKPVPSEFINDRGNDVTDAAIEYMKPLILGESYPEYKDGLPSYIPLSFRL